MQYYKSRFKEEKDAIRKQEMFILFAILATVSLFWFEVSGETDLFIETVATLIVGT